MAVYHITNIGGKTIQLLAGDDTKKEVRSGELVDLYKVVEVKQDIVTRSADFKKLEEHPEALQNPTQGCPL